MIITILLIIFSPVCFSQGKSQIKEVKKDSVEIFDTRWTLDSLELAGDSLHTHKWVEGEVIQRNEVPLNSGWTAIFTVPRICSVCYRKEFITQEMKRRKAQSEYGRLQKEVDLRK